MLQNARVPSGSVYGDFLPVLVQRGYFDAAIASYTRGVSANTETAFKEIYFFLWQVEGLD